MIAFSNQSCFLASNTSIRIALELKNPMATNNMMIRRRRHQRPSKLSFESSKFRGHGLMPLRNTTRNLKGCRFCIQIVWSRFGKKNLFLLGNAWFDSGLHRISIGHQWNKTSHGFIWTIYQWTRTSHWFMWSSYRWSRTSHEYRCRSRCRNGHKIGIINRCRRHWTGRCPKDWRCRTRMKI